jgi:hypothetical protein
MSLCVCVSVVGGSAALLGARAKNIFLQDNCDEG